MQLLLMEALLRSGQKVVDTGVPACCQAVAKLHLPVVEVDYRCVAVTVDRHSIWRYSMAALIGWYSSSPKANALSVCSFEQLPRVLVARLTAAHSTYKLSAAIVPCQVNCSKSTVCPH